MSEFFKHLAIQRWDDHRYYHHSRINQSLHLVSALSFLVAYALLFKDPAVAALLAWLVSMTTRQAGHFFFEPLGYDEVNQATHEYKEEIKVGYNLRRKMVLLAIWAAAPVFLWIDPTLLGVFEPHTNLEGFAKRNAAIEVLIAERTNTKEDHRQGNQHGDIPQNLPTFHVDASILIVQQGL